MDHPHPKTHDDPLVRNLFLQLPEIIKTGKLRVPLGQMPQAVIQELRFRFKDRAPICRGCRSYETSFRYFNNPTTSFILQPRYRCKRCKTIFTASLDENEPRRSLGSVESSNSEAANNTSSSHGRVGNMCSSDETNLYEPIEARKFIDCIGRSSTDATKDQSLQKERIPTGNHPERRLNDEPDLVLRLSIQPVKAKEENLTEERRTGSVEVWNGEVANNASNLHGRGGNIGPFRGAKMYEPIEIDDINSSYLNPQYVTRNFIDCIGRSSTDATNEQWLQNDHKSMANHSHLRLNNKLVKGMEQSWREKADSIAANPGGRLGAAGNGMKEEESLARES